MPSEIQVKSLGVAEDGGFGPELCFPNLFYFFSSHQDKYKEHTGETTFTDSGTEALVAWTCIRKTICDIFFAVEIEGGK